MPKPTEAVGAADSLRDKIIGLGERSLRKSYYPQLRQELEALQESRKRLAESEARYRSLVENINDVIFSLDVEGRITYVSPVVRIYGSIRPEEVVGRDFLDFVYEEDRGAVQAGFERILAGADEPHEFRLLVPDSSIRHVRTSSRPLIEEGHVVGLTGVMTDITERKRSEEELARYRAGLEETVRERTAELQLALAAADAANNAKSVFLANMSHELRTPLNAILGFSAMLRQNTQLSAAQADSLDIINRSGGHLLALINDVLEMAKIEAGQMQLGSTSIELGRLVRDVVDMMRLRAEQKGLFLKLEQAPEVPRGIRGDEPRLRQILVNLVGNAVKFTKTGGVTLRLGVRRNERLHLLIEVEDSGPGIRLEDQQSIFRPFVQLAEATEQKGTGLGLAITRQFIELMGGRIAVESAPGKGALFRVDLPVDPAQLPETEAGSHGVVVGLAPGQPPRRILVAEDHQDSAQLLARLMSGIGLETRRAENGEQCVRLFQDWQPDLIWMDRRMPLMDGIEATRRIRGLPAGARVKIVGVTASVFRDQQEEMLAAGMDDLVMKPYQFNEIYDCLARQLGLRYLYGTGPDSVVPAPAEPMAERLAALPETLRQDLSVALEQLECARISELLMQVTAIDQGLGQALSSLAAGFDYQAILRLLARPGELADGGG